MTPLAEDEVLDLFRTCSNAGRWGPDDERGTANYISKGNMLAASGEISAGKVVSLAKGLEDGVFADGSSIRHRMLEESSVSFSALDAVEISPHGFAITHMDALGHVFFNQRGYNDRSADEIMSPIGLRYASIHALREGIFTRAVLLDVVKTLGREWLDPGEPIYPSDLDAAEEQAGTLVEEGDALIVHSGLGRYEQANGPLPADHRPGLAAECVPWMHQRRVALYGGDCVEYLPQPYANVSMPLHMIGSVAMGLVLLDNMFLVPLVKALEAAGRSTFALSVAPLPLARATGSAVNPLAIL